MRSLTAEAIIIIKEFEINSDDYHPTIHMQLSYLTNQEKLSFKKKKITVRYLQVSILQEVSFNL